MKRLLGAIIHYMRRYTETPSNPSHTICSYKHRSTVNRSFYLFEKNSQESRDRIETGNSLSTINKCEFDLSKICVNETVTYL